MMTEATVHVEPEVPLTRVFQLMIALRAAVFRLSGPIANW